MKSILRDQLNVTFLVYKFKHYNVGLSNLQLEKRQALDNIQNYQDQIKLTSVKS